VNCSAKRELLLWGVRQDGEIVVPDGADLRAAIADQIFPQRVDRCRNGGRVPEDHAPSPR
jgi:hypothetical protein